MKVILSEEQVEVAQNAKPQWMPMMQATDELGLTRYLFKMLRLKYGLRAKRGLFDKRVKLINLTEAKRCLQKELKSLEAEE